MDSSGWAHSDALGANNSSGGWQDRHGKHNEHRPRISQYLNGKRQLVQSVRPDHENRPPRLTPSAEPTFSKGFVFSSLPPFSTQLQVRERAFLPYQPCTQSQETCTGQSTMARQSRPAQQTPSSDIFRSTGYSSTSEQPSPFQRPSFGDTTHFQQFGPIRRLAIPRSLRQVRTMEPSRKQSEIAAFREAMLRVPRNEQERREQDALMEAELDKVE
ncbi:hypothetical protein MMC17_000780 [Xylographa soralifera]|nr:hypothetical protein [Xylographa soralifera]